MNELLKEILAGYLREDGLDILAITFLKGGNISKDALVVHYYKQEAKQWYLNTDQISPTGEITPKKVKVYNR